MNNQDERFAPVPEFNNSAEIANVPNNDPVFDGEVSRPGASQSGSFRGLLRWLAFWQGSQPSDDSRFTGAPE